VYGDVTGAAAMIQPITNAAMSLKPVSDAAQTMLKVSRLFSHAGIQRTETMNRVFRRSFMCSIPCPTYILPFKYV
jgi:hypothetical protein